MKIKTSKKKASVSKGTRQGKRFSIDEDSFFSHESKRRRRAKDEDAEDDIIESEEEDDEEGPGSDADGEDEFAAETADEKRLRVAKAYVEKIRGIVSREREDEEEESEGDDEEREGRRDSLVARILQQEQLEDSGRVRRLIASRYIHLIFARFGRDSVKTCLFYCSLRIKFFSLSFGSGYSKLGFGWFNTGFDFSVYVDGSLKKFQFCASDGIVRISIC